MHEFRTVDRAPQSTFTWRSAPRSCSPMMNQTHEVWRKHNSLSPVIAFIFIYFFTPDIPPYKPVLQPPQAAAAAAAGAGSLAAPGAQTKLPLNGVRRAFSLTREADSFWSSRTLQPGSGSSDPRSSAPNCRLRVLQRDAATMTFPLNAMHVTFLESRRPSQHACSHR